MQELEFVTLDVGGKLFKTTPSTLCNSKYFNGLLKNTHIDKPIFIDRSSKIFKHILEYLRDPNYPFPDKYIYDLDFYGIPRSKYSVENTKDSIIINVNGSIFNLNASKLIIGSKYFAKIIPTLYIGQTLYIDRSVRAFKHVIERIYHDNYVLPYKYANEIEFYGLNPVNLNKNSEIFINVNGKEYILTANILSQFPVLQLQFMKTETLPHLNVDTKAFEKVMLASSISNSNGKIHVKAEHENLAKRLGMKVDVYHNIYSTCNYDDKCTNTFKTKVFKEDNEWRYEAISCIKHRCIKCSKPLCYFSTACKEHTCKRFGCFNVVENEKVHCTMHLLK